MEIETRSGLSAFGDQNTVILTTYRRDGSEVDTPVHIAVEGDHAFIRTYARTWKARRLRADPRAVVWPATIGRMNAMLATMRQKDAKRAGAGVSARARILSGREYKHAARVLRHRFPLAHGLIIPLTHRLWRTQTINVELTAG